MLPREYRKVVRAVPSLEPSFEDLFDQISMAWSLKPPMSSVPFENATLPNRGGGYYISALANVETPEVYYTEVIRIKRAHPNYDLTLLFP